MIAVDPTSILVVTPGPSAEVRVAAATAIAPQYDGPSGRRRRSTV